MLKINNLHAQVGDTKILNGLNLEVGPGEVHAIMGPNGSRILKPKSAMTTVQFEEY